jgi:SRSO17 transposase
MARMVPLGGTTLAGGSDSSCRLGQFPTAADIPAEYRTARTKPELALAEIDHAIAAGVRFACVLADAGYGLSAPFRQGLTGRKLAWAVGIPRHLKGYSADVQMIWPVTGCGRPRQRHVPDVLSIAAEDMLAQNISWRAVTKGKLKARFAASACADGPPQRIRDKGQQHLSPDEAWLIGEHNVGREEILSHQLAGEGELDRLGGYHQGAISCERA